MQNFSGFFLPYENSPHCTDEEQRQLGVVVNVCVTIYTCEVSLRGWRRVDLLLVFSAMLLLRTAVQLSLALFLRLVKFIE